MKYSYVGFISAICIFIGLGMTVDQSIYESTSKYSGFFAAILAIPSFTAVISWLGNKRGVILITILGFYAMAIETFALLTGFPYGNFEYSDLLGIKFLGLTPWSLFFSWSPLILASYYLAIRVQRNLNYDSELVTISLIVLNLLLLDLVLDPAAVALGLWSYENPSFYYNVDLQNFLGWILTGFLGSLLLVYLKEKLSSNALNGLPSYVLLTTYITVCLWSSALLGFHLIFPGILGFGLCTIMAYYLVSEKSDDV